MDAVVAENHEVCLRMSPQGMRSAPKAALGGPSVNVETKRGQISWFSATTASIHLLFDVYKCLTRPGDRSGASLGPPRPAGRPHRRIPGVGQKTELFSGYPSF